MQIGSQRCFLIQSSYIYFQGEFLMKKIYFLLILVIFLFTGCAALDRAYLNAAAGPGAADRVYGDLAHLNNGTVPPISAMSCDPRIYFKTGKCK